VKQVVHAYEMILASDIVTIGIDLIFGIPRQTLDEWLQDMQYAIDFKPQHISTDNFTFEENSPRPQNLLDKVFDKKSSDEEVNFYLQIWNFLKGYGDNQDEISNFACLGSRASTIQTQGKCKIILELDYQLLPNTKTKDFVILRQLSNG
jgi:oxygen-independent coproporphyrinogen-3 oxidase